MHTFFPAVKIFLLIHISIIFRIIAVHGVLIEITTDFLNWSSGLARTFEIDPTPDTNDQLFFL